LLACNCNSNNYRVNENLPTGFDQQTYKLDQDLGRWGKVFFRWTGSNYSTSSLGTLSGPIGNNNFIEQEQSIGVGWTFTLGSHAVNSFRIGRLEAKADQCGSAVNQSVVSSFGFTGVFPNLDNCARSAPGLIGFSNFSSVGGPVNDTTISYVPTWEFADDFSWVHGNQTIETGFDIRRWLQVRNLAADFLGTFTYANSLILSNGGNGVNGCATLYCGTGNAVADFLLGYYQNSGIFQPGPFSQPPAAYYGSTGRNIFNGPSMFDVDMNIEKVIPITERVHFEIRMEGFKFFNHPNFGTPNTTLTSSTPGVISGTSISNRELQWGAKIIF